jgi:hypothetical protein
MIARMTGVVLVKGFRSILSLSLSLSLDYQSPATNNNHKTNQNKSQTKEWMLKARCKYSF